MRATGCARTLNKNEVKEGSGYGLTGMGWESARSRVSKGVGFRKAGELGNGCECEKSEIVFKWPP